MAWSTSPIMVKPTSAAELGNMLALEELDLSENEIRTFHDDRKAKKGGDNDLYMLKNHGFDKYRHLSNGFIKRNLQPSAPRPVAAKKSASLKKKKGKGKGKK